MSKILDLFSKRKRDQERSGEVEVYQYDDLPQSLMNQIMMILSDAIGRYDGFQRDGGYGPQNSDKSWKFIIDKLAREYGDFSIIREDSRKACFDFLQNEKSIERKLDLVELSFRVVDRVKRKYNRHQRESHNIKMDAEAALEELNDRFREAGIGYQYENGYILRVDSQYVHSETIKAALTLLHDEKFSGAEEEFLSAHKHYRVGEHKDAIVDAGAAFESTLKTICDLSCWTYDTGSRASDLIKVVKRNKLFPDYLDSSFDQLLGTLKSGLPSVRNNEGSHGQGSELKTVQVTSQLMHSICVHQTLYSSLNV